MGKSYEYAEFTKKACYVRVLGAILSFINFEIARILSYFSVLLLIKLSSYLNFKIDIAMNSVSIGDCFILEQV